ncbi:hypothetical protein C7448_101368 [Tenacibaculum gallaicum]|uniref:Uncharacterized protein n=1 Tax=Tenacibaculum gallaicum TaxID=561505 RepID=A0A3E0IC62_9FLAO|nr:hypothetical protein [Tenacibaculum gallaicum]REH56330.1 hypothetical protein C7448_101368 [Tenacibaculum gallaicum]
MLKNISNLGVVLDSADLKTINGGRVKCTYPDGTGWDLDYKTEQSEFLAGDHCVKTGGTVEFYEEDQIMP